MEENSIPREESPKNILPIQTRDQKCEDLANTIVQILHITK